MTSENCIFGTTQKSKCLCGTGGHIYDCGCGKRQSLCLNAIARKESGELPQRVTKEYLEELEQNFKSEDERKTYYDAKALIDIYSKCRRDFDTGCLLYNARQPDARGRVMAVSKYDGETAASRIVYRIEVDPNLQDADWVEHTCDDRACVEWTHMSKLKRNDEGPEYFNRRYQEVLSVGVRDGNCLLWKQYINPKGYGHVKVNGNSLLIHRFSFMMANGLTELPEGMHVRHSHSGKRNCYDPRHLSLGTAEENGQDRVDHGTTLVGQKHHNACITDEIATHIYDLYDKNVSAEMIARQFHVGVHVIKGLWFRGTYSTATGDVDARTAEREKERAKRKKNFDNELSSDDYKNAVERIKKRVTIDEQRGCWRVSCSQSNTYPSICIRGKVYRCHRIMFEALKNNEQAIEEGLWVLHTCEERGHDHYSCCLIDHLKKGAPKENAIDHVLTQHENVDTVKKIKRDLLNRMAPKDIAAKYEKNVSAIYAIKNGTHYSYIEAKDEQQSEGQNEQLEDLNVEE